MEAATLEKLHQELSQHSCLWCANTNYKVEGNISQIVLPGQSEQDTVIPFAIVTCMSCGFQYFFNAVVRKLVFPNAQLQVPQIAEQSLAIAPDVRSLLKEQEEDIERETRRIYAAENRAGVLMGVTATIITILFVVPSKQPSIGYLNLVLLAPLMALLPSFFFYMFTFLPSLTVRVIQGEPQPGTPGQPSTVTIHGLEQVKTKIDQAAKTKPHRIRWGHSLLAAGVVGLTLSQVFVQYAAASLSDQTAREYGLELGLLIALQALVVLFVRTRFSK